jgi:hypothetical protein
MSEPANVSGATPAVGDTTDQQLIVLKPVCPEAARLTAAQKQRRRRQAARERERVASEKAAAEKAAASIKIIDPTVADVNDVLAWVDNAETVVAASTELTAPRTTDAGDNPDGVPDIPAGLYPCEPGQTSQLVDETGRILQNKDKHRAILHNLLKAKNDERMSGGRMKLKFNKDAAPKKTIIPPLSALKPVDSIVTPAAGTGQRPQRTGPLDFDTILKQEAEEAAQRRAMHATLHTPVDAGAAQHNMLNRGKPAHKPQTEEEVARDIEQAFAECGGDMKRLCKRVGIPTELAGKLGSLLPHISDAKNAEVMADALLDSYFAETQAKKTSAPSKRK